MKLITKSKLPALSKLIPVFSLMLLLLNSTNLFATGISFDVTRNTSVSYSSISSTGNSVASWRNGTNTDDNLSNSVAIGFNFSYQGFTYSNILISTNGFITFNTATAETGGGSIYGAVNSTLASTSVSTLAPFYDDLSTIGNPFTAASLNSSIKYLVTGSVGSRIFTVEWIGMQTLNYPGSNLNFQVKLYETSGSIEFIYGTMEGFNGSANTSDTYSCGINASVISATPAAGELLNQLTANTRNFGITSSFNLNIVPECNSRLLFTVGTYTAYVGGSTVPANNDPAGAIVLAVNSTPCVALCGTYYSSANATLSSVAVCNGNADDDVWFSFTATNPATTIKVLSSGGYDAVVQLLSNSLTNITCQNATGSGSTETISTTNLVVGTSYYVRVYSAGVGSGTNGMFSICISATPVPPSNDNCSGAINLAVALSQTMVNGTNTTTATASPGVPAPCNGSVADDDVWYSFTAIATTAVIVVQSGSGFDAAVELFSGSCSSLSVLLCSNATSIGGTETLNVSGLSINSTYYIRVYHAATGAGSGNFTIGVYSLPPSCPSVNSYSPANGTSNVNENGVTLSWGSVSGATGYDVYLDIVNPPTHVLISNTSLTSVFSGVLVRGNTYYWRVAPRNGSVVASSCILNAFAPPQPPVGLYVKAFLQGLYIGNKTMQAAVNPSLYPTLADTITISLARSTTPYDIMFSSKTTLSTSGLAHASFPAQALLGNYYIVVNHRNSLETWSYIPFGYNTNDTTFDLTSNRSTVARMRNPQQQTTTKSAASMNSISDYNAESTQTNTQFAHGNRLSFSESNLHTIFNDILNNSSDSYAAINDMLVNALLYFP